MVRVCSFFVSRGGEIGDIPRTVAEGIVGNVGGAAVWSVPGRLAAMMFLQYFGLSAMIVPLTRYLQTPPVQGGLGFGPAQVSAIYMTFAIGAIVAPLIVGLLADRWFAVEKVIAGTHAVMAALMGTAGWWCDNYDGMAADPADAVVPLFALMLGYALGTQITLTLSIVI